MTMSLKAFHVVFIFICLLLAVGTGIWGVLDYRSGGPAGSLYLGVGGMIAAAVLAGYGAWFLKKLKHLSYV